MYRVFATSSTCVNGLKKLFIFKFNRNYFGLLTDGIKHFWLFLSCLIVLNNHMRTVKMKS